MHRITESLTELLWELYSVILVEELPNRNCFGINSVIFVCAMVLAPSPTDLGEVQGIRGLYQAIRVATGRLVLLLTCIAKPTAAKDLAQSRSANSPDSALHE